MASRVAFMTQEEFEQTPTDSTARMYRERDQFGRWMLYELDEDTGRKTKRKIEFRTEAA